ncbi:hypothetical protein [Viridibacillus arvi]|uniref:hypothetical protein n=1 Tax=Viridibacillus arvi TaxID=263475 RepID=UPI0034CD5B1A
MEKPRLIRYLENGVYKYASVKDVGDLSLLKTKAKSDIVSAINELYASGGANPVDPTDPEIIDRITELEKESNAQSDKLKDQESKLDTIKKEYDLSKEDILYLQNTQNEVKEMATEAINKADEVESKANQIKEDLLNKVDENKYQEEYDKVILDLKSKVSDKAFNGLTGRVDTVETDITNLEGEISTRVTSTQFDDAFGVNKWILSKYPITATDLSQTPPSFQLIRGMQATEVIEIEDSSNIPVPAGSNQISHFFTNVYLKKAKTITLNTVFDDTLTVYMNGAVVYQSLFNNLANAVISMSLREGWNTIEILHGQETGVPVLNVGSAISTLVDKMTTVIGVGDKNETRFTQAETLIQQTSDSILLKADKTEVESIGNKVTATEASIEVLSESITSKVEKKEFDAYSQRLSTAESTISQHSDEIALKVEKKDYDLLNDRVSDAEATISLHSDEIALKVSSDDFDGLAGRVETAESQISVNTEAILLKANQTSLDNVTERLTSAEGEIKVANDEILLRATKTEVEALEESTGKLISEAKAEIEITTDGIKQEVSDISKTVGDQGTIISSNSSSIETMKDQISLKVTKTEVTDAIGAIKIGGTNLVRNSTFNQLFEFWSSKTIGKMVDPDSDKPNSNVFNITNTELTTDELTQLWSDPIQIDADGTKEYTVSFDIKTSNVAGIDSKGVVFSVRTIDGTGMETKFQHDVTKVEVALVDNVWTRYSVTIKPTAGKYIEVSPYVTRNGDVFWREIQLEEGNKATSYSLANDDVSTTLTDLQVRVSNAEQVINEDSIISTVTSSRTFQNALDEKASVDSLADYATNDDLATGVQNAKDDAGKQIDDKLKNLNLSTFEEFAELKTTAQAVTTNFKSAGGVNLIKNSVGFAGLDFWGGTNTNGIGTTSNDADIENLGFGSGFVFKPSTGVNTLVQEVSVKAGEAYTLSWMISKTNASPSANNDGAFVLQILDENDKELKSFWYRSEDVTTGFKSDSITYTPTVSKIKIRAYAYKLADAILTGLMLNIGIQPLQWTMAHGEIYNTSIRMDMSGIRVAKIEDAKETKFTIMTPDRFAGYYDVNGDGVIDSTVNSPDEVFRMDDDSFVMKKTVVKEEMAMGAIKILNLNTSAYQGWAFIPSE